MRSTYTQSFSRYWYFSSLKFELEFAEHDNCLCLGSIFVEFSVQDRLLFLLPEQFCQTTEKLKMVPGNKKLAGRIHDRIWVRFSPKSGCAWGLKVSKEVPCFTVMVNIHTKFNF